jgi:hypothetical protein
MQIIVTCPDTIFGEIVKIFNSYLDAMKWVEVCIANDVKVVVEKTRNKVAVEKTRKA